MTIIDRFLEPVAPSGRGKVRPEDEADQDLLLFPALLIVNPDDAPGGEVLDQDAIGG